MKKNTVEKSPSYTYEEVISARKLISNKQVLGAWKNLQKKQEY